MIGRLISASHLIYYGALKLVLPNFGRSVRHDNYNAAFCVKLKGGKLKSREDLTELYVCGSRILSTSEPFMTKCGHHGSLYVNL